MSSYIDVLDAVGNYYGTGSDIWQKIATSGAANLTPQEINAIRQVPGVNVTVTNSGSYAGWDFENPFPSSNNPASDVNSNVPNKTYGSNSFNGRVNGTYHWDGQTARLTSGARKVSTGTRVATVAGKLNTAMTAVAAGCFLGAKIDSALYNVGKFFDLNPPESLNPETWDSLASTELGKSVIRHLFDIEGDGGTMYMPEDMIEYMYKFWDDLGAFSRGEIYTSTYTPTAEQAVEVGKFEQPIRHIQSTGSIIIENADTGSGYSYATDTSVTMLVELNTNYPSTSTVLMLSRTPFNWNYKWSNNPASNPPDTLSRESTASTTLNGTTFYYAYRNPRIASTSMPINYQTSGGTLAEIGIRTVATIIFDGTTTPPSGGIEGFEPDPDAEQPGTINPNQPILPQLKQNMPNTFTNPIQETVPQPDGTNKTITYYPVPWPKVTDDTDKPTSGTSDQSNPKVTPNDPADETSPLVDVITNPNPQPTTPTPGGPATTPDTGSGSSPTVVAPTGNASSLWAVYNPTQAQLDAFGSWLWSSNFVEQIKKLFNDPMQAIVGVHKVFATPSTDGQVNIKCGYIDSGCPAARVSNQYTTINCGTVSVREFYGNVLDYSPFTEISLYLPFIGIVKLDVADVMRGSVQVKYHVDVITGACLADVIVHRDGEDSVLYQYSGSAIVTYPISSGSYASMAAGVLSLAAGVAGTIATGGAAAPALIGGAVGLSHLHTDVQKSGSFSGSPGAMGCKKPYLIISRAQEAVPTDFEKYEGKPASKTVRVGDCDGFIKVKSINIDNVPATYGELDQIVALLKTGVIL